MSCFGQGEEWKKTTLKTALLFPGIVFAIFFMLNLLVWGQRSSGAVPFGTLFALCFLWFGISVPLVFIGSYFGYKKPAPEVRHLLRPRPTSRLIRVEVPLGGWVGDAKSYILLVWLQDPVRTNKIPRQIPEQAWYMNPVFSVLIGGILPFGSVFIELFFILTSMWLQQVLRAHGSIRDQVAVSVIARLSGSAGPVWTQTCEGVLVFPGLI